MSDKLKLESPWERVKEMLQEINLDLTDDDLSYEPGMEDQLLERVSKKMGRSKEEARMWIESVSANRDKAG